MNNILKKSQKGLTIASIACLGLCLLMLILSMLGAIEVFQNNYMTAILLTLTTFTVCLFFVNNCIDIVQIKQKLTLVTISLLVLSSVMILVWIWYNLGVKVKDDKRDISEIYKRITGIISITTVLFTIIATSTTKLQRHYLALQIATFVLVGAIDVVLVLQICNVKILDHIATVFVICCIVAFGLLCTINILSKRIKPEQELPAEFVKIKKEEYEMLLEKARKYDEEHSSVEVNTSENN